MAADVSIGRLGPLAAALGIGAAIVICGSGIAAADSPDAVSSPTSSSAKVAAHRVRPARPVAARNTKPAASGRAARRVAPAAATHVVTANQNALHASASSGGFGGLAVLLNNQTPTLHPTQIAFSDRPTNYCITPLGRVSMALRRAGLVRSSPGRASSEECSPDCVSPDCETC